MDALYYLSGILTIVGLPLLCIATVVALIKPHLVNNRRAIKNSMSRKKIATIGVTAILVSFISLSSVLAATEPVSIKQERAAREAAESKALQIQQQQAEADKKVTEEAVRKREEEANKPIVKIETKTEVVAFESVEKNDDTLPSGEKKLSVSGVNGERTITYEVTYVRDKETARKEVKNETTTKPITQVTLNGTYVKPTTSAPKSTLIPQSSTSSEVVKMSKTGICHAPGSTYYSRTKHYTSYNSLSACLNAGGRMPKR